MAYVAMTKCVYCGKPKGEIVIDKRMRDNAFQDMYVYSDFNPCDECKAHMAEGVTLIGVEVYDPAKHGKIPKKILFKSSNVDESLVPTGQFLVLDEVAPFCRKLEKHFGQECKKGSKFFIEQEMLEQIRGVQK